MLQFSNLLGRWTSRDRTTSVAITSQCSTLLVFHFLFARMLRKTEPFIDLTFPLYWWNRYTQIAFLIGSGNTDHSSVLVKCRVQFWVSIAPRHVRQLPVLCFPSVFGWCLVSHPSLIQFPFIPPLCLQTKENLSLWEVQGLARQEEEVGRKVWSSLEAAFCLHWQEETIHFLRSYLSLPPSLLMRGMYTSCSMSAIL